MKYKHIVEVFVGNSQKCNLFVSCVPRRSPHIWSATPGLESENRIKIPTYLKRDSLE